MILLSLNYVGHSKSNASYFIMLAHNIRGGCWWYGSRGWTFPPISHYKLLLLLCDRWQQRSSLTEWRLIWKCIWSKGASLKSSMWKTWHPLTLVWHLWKSNRGCEHSEGRGVVSAILSSFKVLTSFHLIKKKSEKVNKMFRQAFQSCELKEIILFACLIMLLVSNGISFSHMCLCLAWYK